MNILIINSLNPLKNSGTVAIDVFNALKTRGHKVKLLVNIYSNEYPEDIIAMQTPFSVFVDKYKRKIVRKFFNFNNIPSDPNYHFHHLKEDKLHYSTNKLLKKAGLIPDIILVLFAKDFLNSRNFAELNKLTKAPIYWLMYDMAPLTGGCHYAWECKGYENLCGKCPGLFSENSEDITHFNLKYKKYYLDQTDIKIIAASEWQYRQAKRSNLFKQKSVFKVLLSIDPTVFQKVDKKIIRTKLGIEPGRKVIFFGSVDMRHLRKGAQYLVESLNLLKEKTRNTDLDDKILLLIAGKGIEEIQHVLPFEIKYLGYVDDRLGLASAYQAADIFLCPSIEDSGPSMINQSLMCGTPVVSFEMGVSPDLVINQETGYMAELRNSQDMADGIYEILSLTDEKHAHMSQNCRELAMNLCSPDKQIDQFESLFKQK